MYNNELKKKIEVEVLAFLKPPGLPKWWNTKLPYKHNQTPNEIWEEGRGEELLDYVKGYANEDFI